VKLEAIDSTAAGLRLTAPLRDGRRVPKTGPARTGLRARAMGAGGLALARIAAQAMQFALFLYAARVLTTADFGVFSLAFAIIVGLTVLAEAGWREWVLCAPTPRQIDEAGAAALMTGAVIAVLGMALIALGRHLGFAPELAMMAGLLLPWVVARPLVSVHMGVLTRAGRLRHMAVVQWLCEAAGFVAGVALLHHGAGLAALAWAKLALLGVELGGYTLGAGRLGLAVPRAAGLGEMTRFSWHILAARVLTYLQGNLTTLVIGAAFSPALVGLYRAAMRLGGTAQEVIREPARAVGWSWLRAALDRDNGSGAMHLSRGAAAVPLRLHATAHQFLDVAVTVGAALFVVLALESTGVVRLLLGARWSDAAGLVMVLSLGMIARLPQALAEPLFPLIGKAWLTRRQALLTAGAGLGCFLLALPFGIMAVALGDMIAALLMLGPLLFYLVAEGGLSLRLALRPFALALVSGLGCAGVALMLAPAGQDAGFAAIFMLMRNSLALGAVFVAIQLALRRLMPAHLFFRSFPVFKTKETVR